MIGASFKLKSDRPYFFSPCRYFVAAKGLHGLAISQGMSCRRVSGQGLNIVNAAFVRAIDKGVFNTSVLVAERYLEVKDPLPMALKAKVARLYDAGVHRPYRHLMHLLTFNPEKVRNTRGYFLIFWSCPDILARAAAFVEANRLEPWMTFRAHPPLLGYLPFKQVGLDNMPGKRRV